MQRAGESYDRLAWMYESAAHFYSGGKIQALKVAQIEALQPGERVLYAGVGSGEDAVLAARRGVLLTVIDLSPEMLERASRKFRDEHVEDRIEVVCIDAFKHDRENYYDVIVANFFLNIFSRPTMEAMLAHLVKLLRPGGRILIGDFSYPRGPFPMRMVQRTYYFLSMFSFWLFGGTTLHPIYDYPYHFVAVSLEQESVQRFKVSPLLPASFETITAVKA